MNGVGAVIEFKFPLFKLTINWMFFPISLPLPQVMPIGCITEIKYYGTLMQKTVAPFGFVAFAFVFSTVAKSTARGRTRTSGSGCRRRHRQERVHGRAAHGKVRGRVDARHRIFHMFFFYPSASVASVLYFSCKTLNGPGESKLEYLIQDTKVNCADDIHLGPWLSVDWFMLIGIGFGVPFIYLAQFWWFRVDLDRLRRFQVEAEDLVKESEARKNTVSELTIDEFERVELMRLLEEAEVERIEKKRFSLMRTLPIAVKKLTNGYTSKCFWFEVRRFSRTRAAFLVHHSVTQLSLNPSLSARTPTGL